MCRLILRIGATTKRKKKKERERRRRLGMASGNGEATVGECLVIEG